MKKQRIDKWFLILIITVNIIFILSSSYFFFGKIDLSAGNHESKIKIGTCFMTMDSTYFKMLNNEIDSIVKANGDILITRDPRMDQRKQNEQIDELIQEGVKAILITPVNWKEIEPSVRKAREKGIKIIVVDSQIYDSSLVDCSVTSDNFDAGIQIANYLMTQVSSARIVLLEHANVKSSMDRINGFSKAISGFPKFKIVATMEYEGDEKSAFSAMNQVFDLGVAFDAVFAVNDAGAFGAYAALEKNQYVTSVSIMGVNGSPDGKDMIKKKKMIATAAQFPSDMGRKAADSMYVLLNNEPCEKEIYVPVKLITKYTIDSYDTDKWQ